MPMEYFIIFISSFAFPFQASRSSVAASSCDSLHLHQGACRAGGGLRRVLQSPLYPMAVGARILSSWTVIMKDSLLFCSLCDQKDPAHEEWATVVVTIKI